MADFNPQIQDTGVPNLTGASRGTGPDRSFEALFSGLTETFGNVTQVKDTATQVQIRDDAEAIFEATNKEFGVAAPEMPDSMASDIDRISVLQDALAQGKISQTNYYGRLATLTKQLRAKYPRYEHIVDQTIQSVTGTRPANAYRDALFSEMNDILQGQSDEEKFRRQYEKENEGILAAIYGEDYFQDPSKYDFSGVRSRVSSFKGKAELIQAEREELSLMSSRGEFNDKRANKAISRDFSFVVESTLTKGLNLNSPDGMSKINEFIQKGGGTAEELDAFIQDISSLESTLRATLVEKGRREYVTSGILTQTDVNKAVEEALFPIQKAREAVLGGDFKLASRYATLNKSIQDQQLNEMLERSPELRAGMGLTEVNEALGAEFLQRHQLEISDVALEVAGRAMTGNQDAVELAVKSGNNKVARATIDTSFDAITDPKLQGERFDNLVRNFFGGKVDFMSSEIVAAEDLERVYTKFLSPDVTKAIFSKGSPETQRVYTEWALDKAQAIPAFRAAAADLKNVAQLDSLEVRFDPESFSLQLFNRDGRVDNGYYYGRTANAANKALTVLRPIFEAQGGDVTAQAERFFRNLGGTLGEPQEGGLFSRIGEAIRESGLTTPIGEAVGRRGDTILPFAEDGEEVPPSVQVEEEELGGTSELDFVFSSPEIASELTGDPVYSPSIERAASGGFTGPLEDFRGASTPVELASKFDGLHERRDKDVISSFIRKATGTKINPAKTPWCAAFVNAVLGASGQAGTGSLAARSFLNYGSPTDAPTKGDIVILRRGNSSWQGHVGFYVGEDENTISILGGNQGNRVSVKRYPKSSLLGYRRPPRIQ